MSSAIKSAVFFTGVAPSGASHTSFRSVRFFHSTPALERNRRIRSNPRYYYSKRVHKMNSKMSLLRDMSDYAEHLFQSWSFEDDQSSFPSHDDTPWFRRQYWSKGAKLNGFNSNYSQWGRYNNRKKGEFNFFESDDDDDDDVETVFGSAFRGENYYYWSFHSSENFQWRSSYHQNNHKSSSNWRYETDDETDRFPESDLVSDRRALGLKASGPLKLEDVKHAYRACALRWHPDRHQGSSKIAAEEKFKHCSAAYKSLCENLAVE